MLAVHGRHPSSSVQVLLPAQGFLEGRRGKKVKPSSEDGEAAERARGLMRGVAALPLDELSPEEGCARARALYEQFAADAQRLPALKRLLEG